MSRGDDTVDRTADSLQEAADTAGASGGLRAKLADELAEDAAFVRKLKPSLIRARIKGEAPTGPQLGPRPKAPGSGGPNPYLVLAAALAAGILLAKLIDWRSHAHPRD